MSENNFLHSSNVLGLYQKICQMVSPKITWVLDTYISIYEY